MELLKTCLRWTHRVFWYTLAGVIISLAIVISLVRVFIPDVKVYRTQIEHIASSFLGQEVHIKSMDARLSGITPMIVFRGVRMLDDTGKHVIMRFAEVRLGLDFWRSLANEKVIPKTFTVYGVKLGITRRRDKTLVLQGLNISKFEQQINAESKSADITSSELARWLFERSTLSLKHSTLVWHDELRGDKTMQFDDVNLDIRNDGSRHQFTGTVSLPQNMGNRVAVAFDFHGNILNPSQWQGKFYVNGSNLHISNWDIKPAILHSTFESGLLDLQLWGQWQAGAVTALSADVHAQNFRLNVGHNKNPLDLKLVSGLFDWRRITGGWQLNVNRFQYTGHDGIWPNSSMNITYHRNPNHSARIAAYSSYFQLGDASSLLSSLKVLDKHNQKILRQIAPKGQLSNLYFHYDGREQDKPSVIFSAAFNKLSLRPYKNFPGIAKLSGTVWANQQGGQLKLDNTPLRVTIPNLFRQPLYASQIQGDVQWWHAYGAWHVHAPALALENSDVQAQVALGLSIPDDKASPFLNLQAHFVKGDGRQVSKYLPVGIMDQELIDWIDHGIIGGHVDSGNALFHGRLDDFPFTQGHRGTFLVAFHAKDAELDYRKGWPKISTSNIKARFTGKGLSIHATGGRLYQTHLRDIDVRIDRYMVPVLSIKGRLRGSAHDVAKFLVNTPIAADAVGFYRQSKLSGDVSGDVAISLPLTKAAERRNPSGYRGSVKLHKVTLQTWRRQLIVHDISGHLGFNASGITSQGLVGYFSGEPTHFTVYTQGSKKHQIINVGMTGTADLTALADKLPIQNLTRLVHGKTQWQGLLSLGSNDPASPKPVSLHIVSYLQGVALDLPPPLHKPSKTRQALQLNIDFGKNRLPIKLSLGDTLHAALLLRQTKGHDVILSKGQVKFFAKPAILPAHKQFVISGSIPELPVAKWQRTLKQLTSKANSNYGFLKLPIALDLDYLNITKQKNSKKMASLDPTRITPFSGDIRKLVYNKLDLGHVIIKTSHQSNGLHFDEISLKAPYLKLHGQGSWFLRGGKQHTNVLLSLSSDNVGDMISRLGYKGIIKNGKARAVVQLNWPDAPDDFSFAHLNGTLGTVINDGVMSDVEPGAGRLVGLLSLSQLPQHLALDFSEFRKGLHFKQILAQFDIVDGNAITQNLHVISPIALIDITGRTGLAKRDYDLNISVAPKVSKTLPVISLLAWGSQVGALTFLMDQLFGKQFNESIASTYHVTGTWEHPVMKRVSRPTPTTKKETSP